MCIYSINTIDEVSKESYNAVISADTSVETSPKIYPDISPSKGDIGDTIADNASKLDELEPILIEADISGMLTTGIILVLISETLSREVALILVDRSDIIPRTVMDADTFF